MFCLYYCVTVFFFFGFLFLVLHSDKHMSLSYRKTYENNKKKHKRAQKQN